MWVRRVPLFLLLLLIAAPAATAACRTATLVMSREEFANKGGPAPFTFQVWFDCVSNGDGHTYRAVVDGPENFVWTGSDCDDKHDFTLTKPGQYEVILQCDGQFEDNEFLTITGGGGGGGLGGFDLPEGMGTFLAFAGIVGVAVAIAAVMTKQQKRARDKQAQAPPRSPPQAAAPAVAPMPVPPPVAPAPMPGAWQEIPDPRPQKRSQATCTLTPDRVRACPNERVTFTLQCSEPLASVTWRAGEHAGQAHVTGSTATFTLHLAAPADDDPTDVIVTAQAVTATGAAARADATVHLRGLSGANWAGRYGFINDVETGLQSPFKEAFNRFYKDLVDARAQVSIRSVWRDARRQYLMWGSSRIARGRHTAVATENDGRGDEGTGICWCHRDAHGTPSPAKARAAAKLLADAFGGLPYGAERESNHSRGLAVDMTVRWQGTLQLPGQAAITEGPRDESNPHLAAIAAAYGVRQFTPRQRKDLSWATDPVHWSVDGQ